MKRMIIGIVLALSLLTASRIEAATLSSQTCPGTGCVDYIADGSSTGSIQITVSNDWSGTITFQASIDGTNFVTFVVKASTQTAAATLVGTTTGAGVFLVNLSGIKILRINCTSYSAGTATVTASFLRQSRTMASVVQSVSDPDRLGLVILNPDDTDLSGGGGGGHIKVIIQQIVDLIGLPSVQI